MSNTDEYYLDENISSTEEYFSKSNKYKLIVKKYCTKNVSKKNTWEITQAFVYKTDDNQLITSIKRNYFQFPYLFFEKNNKEYLICGSTYMSQTIVDLESGKVFDNKGKTDGFCWASIYQFNENTIYVLGCYWGATYEYKFYDFTDFDDLFENGLKKLDLDEEIKTNYYLDCDMYKSVVSIDNNIITFEFTQKYYKCSKDNCDCKYKHDEDIDMPFMYWEYEQYYESKLQNFPEANKLKKYKRIMVKISLTREDDKMKTVSLYIDPIKN